MSCNADLQRWFSIASAGMSQYTLCPKNEIILKSIFELLHSQLTVDDYAITESRPKTGV